MRAYVPQELLHALIEPKWPKRVQVVQRGDYLKISMFYKIFRQSFLAKLFTGKVFLQNFHKKLGQQFLIGKFNGQQYKISGGQKASRGPKCPRRPKKDLERRRGSV